MNEGGLPNLDTEAVIYSDVSTLSHRQQVVGDSLLAGSGSPLVRFADIPPTGVP